MAYFRGKKVYIGFGSTEIAMAAKIGAIADGSITTLTARDLAGITEIAPYRFYSDRSLQAITMPDTLITIGGYAFYQQNYIGWIYALQSVNFGRSVRNIGMYSFYWNKNIDKIILPSSIETIGDHAFYNCASATIVDIGAEITSIGDYAFSNCVGLNSITIRATTPPTFQGSSVFAYTSCPIYVPAESVDAYKTATNLTGYASRIQAIPS